jgi:hypothetical protein
VLVLEFHEHNTRRARVDPRPIARSELLTDALNRTDAMLAGSWVEHDSIAAPCLNERQALLQGWSPKAPLAIIPNAGRWVQYKASDSLDATLLRVLKKASGLDYE